MNDFSFLRRRNSQLLVACLFAILGMTLALREASAQTNGWHLKTTYSRLPATVDLPNPGRGYIRSGFLSSYANPHFTSTETYTRFSWADIEKAEGTYNFAVIDQMLGKLAAGQRLSFRIYGVNPCFSAHQRTLSLHGASVAVDFDIPEYLMQEKAWYAPNYYVISGTSPCSNGSTYVALPDWNSDRFLNSVTRLFAALGAKYDKDPRIGSIDFGVFGDWGEWHSEPVSKDKEHTWGKYPYCDSTYNAGGALLVTESSMKKIIDSVAAGFQNKQLILNIGADYAVVAYALKLQAKTPVGLRSDSWTNSWFITGMLSSGRYVMPGGGPTPGGACARTSIPLSAAERAVVMDNWQKAPFIAESFASYGSFVDSDFVAQILNCKVTQIHNGSWGKPYQTLSKEIQAGLDTVGISTGFRLGLASVSLVAGTDSIAVTTTWDNTGISPPYVSWPAKLAIYDVDGKVVVAETTSALSLRTLMPATTYGDCSGTSAPPTPIAPPTTVTDSLPISTLTKGKTYELRIRISDPDNYLEPLRIDMTNRNNDGSYTVGLISDGI